jgi:hypothetical protein
MAKELNPLADATTTALALSSLILVTPQVSKGYQPQDKNGNLLNQTFVFSYEGEQMSQFGSTITDHFTENNESLQDHIALKPEIFKTTGYVGELGDFIPDLPPVLRQLQQKLILLSAFAPELSASAQNAYNQAFQSYQAVQSLASSVNSWKSIDGEEINVIGSTGLRDDIPNINPNQTKQQIAYQQLYGYWRSRTLFTIQTPWAIFKNMAIEDVRAIQGEDTKSYSTFEVSWKMIRFAQVKEVYSSESSIFNNQLATEKNIGEGSTGADQIFDSRLPL